MELIDSWVYNPLTSFFGTKKDKAKGYTIHCSCPEKCDAYKHNKCILTNQTVCLYGKKTEYLGLTPKANKFNTWIDTFKENNTPKNPKKLDFINNVAFIGDNAVILNISHLNLNEKLFKEKSEYILQGRYGYFNSIPIVVKREFLTPDNIYNYIIDFKPISLSGYVIEDYQTQHIGNFLMYLNIICPELVSELKEKYDLNQYKIEDYIGKKAYLNTLLPGEFIISKKKWHWDGVYLSSNEPISCFIVDGHYSEIRIKPNDKCVVEITDNNQVTKDTKFK
ncbi:MAG: hypothetical protein RSE41_00055 [Clostridia bacterium]